MSIYTIFDTNLSTVEESMETDQGNEESRIPHLAHDLANFIEGIRLVLEETPWEHVDRTELLQRVMIMEQCSNHAADVCRQLMEKKLDSEPQETRLGLVDLASITEELSGVLELFVGSRGKLEISSDGRMSAYYGDATELRQILLDLVTNARDALGSTDGRIRIHCGCADQIAEQDMIFSKEISFQWNEPHVYLEIEDNGQGIPAEILANFFEHRVSTKSAGHGLGISSVIRIVHRHGGAIGVRSTEGEGTRVRCMFPRAEFSGPGPLAAPAPWDEMACLDRQISVLLIEDSHAVCRLATLQLEKATGLDCKIVTASSLRQGIECFRQADPPIDVVITDMMLPDGLGSTGLEQIRQIKPHQPVIVMSGLSREELEGCFSEQRPNGFLFKPLHTKEIISLLKKVVLD